MTRHHVLVSASTFAVADRTPLDTMTARGCQVTLNPVKRRLTKPEVIELLSHNVVGLIAGVETLDREVLERSTLRVVSRVGSGLSNVDLDAAKTLGIKVCSTPDAPTNAVAELTLGALLSLLRGTSRMDRSMHQRKWEKTTGVELRGKTVAVVGFGRIGQRVATLLQGFGASVVAVDPAYAGTQPAVRKMELRDALPIADVITLHSSGSDRILSAAEFALMKDGVFVLNAARGALVDDAELCTAIGAGRVAGAWFDTFDQEPYAGPLCDLDQVMLTPHVGSYTRECRSAMEMEAVEHLLSVLEAQ